MPGNYCVVACCRNYFGKTKKYEATSSISYHKFPKDPNLRYLWIKACGKEGELIRNSSSVCSKHFKIEDFGDYEKTVLKKDGKIKCLKNKLKQGGKLISICCLLDIRTVCVIFKTTSQLLLVIFYCFTRIAQTKIDR